MHIIVCLIAFMGACVIFNYLYFSHVSLISHPKDIDRTTVKTSFDKLQDKVFLYDIVFPVISHSKDNDGQY